MRKLFSSFLLLMTLLVCSCGKESFELDREDIIGLWQIVQAKFDESASMADWELGDTFFTFEDNGLFYGAGYFGDVEGTYSVSGNTLISKIDNQPFFIYEVTGLKGDSAEINAIQQSNHQKIWMIWKKIEVEVVPPMPPLSPESYFKSEENIQVFINRIYKYLVEFIEQENKVLQKYFDGTYSAISPINRDVSLLYSSAYSLLRNINYAYQAINEVVVDNKEDYLSHLRVIRGFLGYNLTTLWGNVAYFGYVLGADDEFPVMPQSDVLDAVIKDLNVSLNYKFGNIQESYYLNSLVAVILRAECYLSLGDSGAALQLLNDYTATDIIFQYNVSSNSEEWVTLFSKGYYDLLKLEASGTIDGLPEKWQQAGISFGYWQMLKRIGKAQEVTGCPAYRLLLPFPESEVEYVPNLQQNQGYD